MSRSLTDRSGSLLPTYCSDSVLLRPDAYLPWLTTLPIALNSTDSTSNQIQNFLFALAENSAVSELFEKLPKPFDLKALTVRR